jgi:hypothetical protein
MCPGFLDSSACLQLPETECPWDRDGREELRNATAAGSEGPMLEGQPIEACL